MKDLPSNVVAYKQASEFTELTIPAGLLKDHKTKDGVWAKIVILEGRLEYTIVQPELDVIELSIDKFGVVEPEVLHHIAPLGNVRLYVEFYK